MYKVYAEQDFVDVADAICAKTGKSAKLAFPDDYIDEIESIGGGSEIAETGTLALGNKTSLFRGSLVKCGHTVTLSGAFSITSYSKGDVVATLPQGFRPIGSVRSLCGIGGSTEVYTMIIDPSGNIIFWSLTASYPTYMDVYITFKTPETTYPIIYDSSKIQLLDGAFGVCDKMAFINARIRATSSNDSWLSSVITIPSELSPVSEPFMFVANWRMDKLSSKPAFRDMTRNGLNINLFLMSLDNSEDLFVEGSWLIA